MCFPNPPKATKVSQHQTPGTVDTYLQKNGSASGEGSKETMVIKDMMLMLKETRDAVKADKASDTSNCWKWTLLASIMDRVFFIIQFIVISVFCEMYMPRAKHNIT